MKIGFIVNDIKTEEATYTTTRLSMEAINQGHEAWTMGVGDLAYDQDENIRARAVTAPKKRYKSHELYVADREEIKAFAREEGAIVLKPVSGSGGASVFLVRKEDFPNLNQMIDAVSRDGYVVAQEYLPAATEGDTRLFVMNGRPCRSRAGTAHSGGCAPERTCARTFTPAASSARPR
ncbi:MAG: hypothetical protein RRA15_13430 [bacterium]|nr:hypothetical protein [bacterium]MDT8367462.1 hypothetical protein [bacterium]